MRRGVLAWARALRQLPAPPPAPAAAEAPGLAAAGGGEAIVGALATMALARVGEG